MKLIAIEQAHYVEGYKIALTFNNGESGIADLSDALDGKMFEPLKDEAFFRQFSLDEWPTLCWPNGADLAPEFLYFKATGDWPPETREMIRDAEAFGEEC